MKIAVCVKPVPAADEIRVNDKNTLVRNGLPLIVNPSDESALEAALRLKGDGEICLITMGSAAAGKTLKSLLAYGADRAVLVSDSAMAGSDTFATAKTLCAALNYLGSFNLVLCGRRAIDGETGQVPPELAVLLGFPFATNVIDIGIAEGSLICDRLLETGIETLRLPLPTLVSLCEYSFPLRPSSLDSFWNSQVKDLLVLDRKMLGLEAEECGAAASPTRVRRVTENESRVRRGERETDIRAGARKLAEMVLSHGRVLEAG